MAKTKTRIHLRSRTYESFKEKEANIDFDTLERILGGDFPTKFKFVEVLEINITLVSSLLDIKRILMEKAVDGDPRYKTIRSFVRGVKNWREVTATKDDNRARVGDNKYVITIYYSDKFKYEIVVLDLMVLEKNNPALCN